ncbi:MAG: hypothetical protein LBU34_09115 [Planctomycetaceae bacterium]|jgi:hypothetical protein|nr:hypothetical protein [Planctomycetaceae bacterium]
MAKSTLEELYIRGLKNGIRKNKKKGEIKRIIRDIFKVLNIRFPKVPQSISQAVNSYKDLIVLDSLLEQAVICETLAEFEQDLAHH